VAAVDNEALRDWLDAKGWTLKDFAGEVGISLQYLCDIVGGNRTLKRNPALRQRMAEALNIPVSRIEKRVEAAS
jgi:transcriptional regulator with XRE-family HTH domain